MSDVIKRLMILNNHEPSDVLDEAIPYIAELEAERDRLREALRPIEREMEIAAHVPVLSDYRINGEPALLIRLAHLNALRAALSPTPSGDK